MKALTTLLAIGMFLTTVAVADDVDDVKAAMQRSQVAVNSGDAYAAAQILLEGHTRFGPTGGLLERFDSVEDIKRNQQARFDAGLKLNIQSRHVEVSVYGNTAVATNYGVGRITFPDGTTGQPNNRITAVLIKQGDQWKVVHRHLSPVRLPQ